MLRLLLPSVLLLSAPALAQRGTIELAGARSGAVSMPKMSSWRIVAGGDQWLDLVLSGAPRGAGEWWAIVDRSARGLGPLRVGLGGFLVDGSGAARRGLPLPASGMPANVRLGAQLFDGGRVIEVESAPHEQPPGETLDFDWGLGGVPQLAGTIVSTTHPWGELLELSVINADPTHPNAAILFDSSRPAPGEEALMTPGTGPGNDTPEGMLLVIARDLVDVDMDGRVDLPRAEPAGGILRFTNTRPYASILSRVRLVGVDEPGGEVRFYEGAELQATHSIPATSPNGVVEVYGYCEWTRFEIELTGSAGVADLLIYPADARIGFDTSSTGVPLGLPAGYRMLEGAPAYEGLLFYFEAENGTPGHPAVPILFDTARVTGNDFDLVTPGYGVGNDRPLGKALILAENDVDANGDGVVDVPDDEAGGGVIRMLQYTSDVAFLGATILDVDADETAWIEIDNLDHGRVDVFPLEPLGDNSVQTIQVVGGPTRRIEFHFTGSIAIAEIVIGPIP